MVCDEEGRDHAEEVGLWLAQAKAYVPCLIVMVSSLQFLSGHDYFVLLQDPSAKQLGGWAEAGKWHQMEDFYNGLDQLNTLPFPFLTKQHRSTVTHTLTPQEIIPCSHIEF